MKMQKDIIITGSASLPISLDIFYDENQSNQSVVIYAHGFNGFKDWGNFDLIAAQAANAGFTFIKFNFSHNGTSPSNPEEFVNLEAFGNNNYSRQLEDLQSVINWTCNENNEFRKHIHPGEIYLVGHSMGGGIAILTAAIDDRIKKLATWASIAECKTPWGGWSDEKINHWKESGIAWYPNSRTNQQMPLYYQLYEDYQANKEQLDIKKAMSKLDMPVLICHGTADPAVPVEKAYELQSLNTQAKLFTVETDHVFGRKHPWETNELPKPMQDVLDKTLLFFKH